MKYKIEYRKNGSEISIYRNVELVGKFPNFEEADPNKGFQAVNEDGEPVRRLEGPLRWAVDLQGASVAIAGPLPPPAE